MEGAALPERSVTVYDSSTGAPDEASVGVNLYVPPPRSVTVPWVDVTLTMLSASSSASVSLAVNSAAVNVQLPSIATADFVRASSTATGGSLKPTPVTSPTCALSSLVCRTAPL